MQKFIFIVVAVAATAGSALASERPTQKASSRFRHGYNRHSSGKEYGSDNGLKEIALSSASRAQTAVSKQSNAALDAAYHAKDNLAREASEAAATARAVLLSKESAYSKLQKQVEESEKALEAELRQYESAERSAYAAREAVENAEKQVETLAETLRKSKAAVIQSRAAVEIATSEAASQKSMITRARESYRSAYHQLRETKANFEATKQVVENAEAAARDAKKNISKAKIRANLEESSRKVYPNYGFSL